MLLLALVVSQAPPPALAAPITLIHRGHGSGSLDGVPFPDSEFVITASGDTDDRIVLRSFFGGFVVGWEIEHAEASISISGLGDFAFVSDTATYADAELLFVDRVGFARPGTGLAGAGLFDGPFGFVYGDWEMLTSIGPVVGTGSLMQWEDPFAAPMLTDAGVLIFDAAAAVAPVSFEAIVVPEPATALLLAGGICALALRAQRARVR